ncbi:MAG: ATP-binding cassette domain-containing protein, partial [Gammaproteobacteria bacterium]|nr:ATP-binding cassette domain-containing protein [Gammaproteobacteria bacterium]
MLEVENLFFQYPRGACVRAHFRAAAGAACALMGASGAGKSTILNLIAGLLTPARGDIRFHGRSLLADKPAARPLTYLLQSGNLFAHLTVRENLAIGLHPGMKLTSEQNRAVERALARVSLGGFAERKPPSLFGGQRQRGAPARGLGRARPPLRFGGPVSSLGQKPRGEKLAVIRGPRPAQKTVFFQPTSTSQP